MLYQKIPCNDNEHFSYRTPFFLSYRSQFQFEIKSYRSQSQLSHLSYRLLTLQLPFSHNQQYPFSMTIYNALL